MRSGLELKYSTHSQETEETQHEFSDPGYWSAIMIYACMVTVNTIVCVSSTMLWLIGYL
jgi:hypothetical protein